MTERETSSIIPTPTKDYPNRAIVSTLTARGVFYTPDHARRYEQHPGSLPRLSDAYLDWCAT